MAVLKLVRNEYRNEDAINNLINYVLDDEKMPNRCFGGNGISLYTPAKCMYTVKSVFHQTTGKQAEHFILAFNKNEICSLTIPVISKIAYDVCDFFKESQILFAVHEVKNTYYSDDYENDSLHIHFILNPINLQNGLKLRIDYNNEFDLKNYIEAVLCNYNVSDKVLLKAN